MQRQAMIRYNLSCDKGHDFDSWFQSAAAYDTLAARGHVACALCGSTAVTKALMAPNVRPTDKTALAAPQTDLEQKLAALRQQVEENSDYVGLSFAAEARAMHEGTIPERAIYGEARLDEAKKLLEDGIPVAPLPFLPKAKAN
jgi:hypothetical protein